MSFLKDLKEDIGSAVDELAADATGEEANSEESTEEVPAGADELEGFDLADDSAVDTDMVNKIMEDEAEEKKSSEKPEKEEKAEMAAEAGELPKGATAPIITGEAPESPVFDENSVDSGKSTVIAKGTVINGSIVSDGSLEVYGTVKGDINCLGKLSIAGSVIGNSTASEVYINTQRLDGGITSKGSVKIGVGTVVIGDITASSLVIAGAVKGEIDVNGPVVVDSTAVVKGNINSKGIQVNNGAVIDGFCALPYASVDIDSFFDEANTGDRK